MTHTFQRFGQLAIEPSALSLAFTVTPLAEPYVLEGDCAIVHIYGPLVARRGQEMCFDSYEEIVERVGCALASQATTVVLCIDSPGGLVSGCLAASRAIRRMGDASGKRVISYVGEQATSAAYALACAAQEIVIPPTGKAGSIGVIEVLPSFARQASAQGVDVTVITSGERKADGNPSTLMSDDARAALQLGVDRMAEAFFELVEEHRPQLAGKVAGLQAAIYYGEDAVTIGLADRLLDFSELKAALAAPQGNADMTKAELLAGLKALAEGDGDDSDMAKRMLAAEFPPEDDAPPSSKPKPAAKKAKAADDADEARAEDDSEEAKAAADEAPPSSAPAGKKGGYSAAAIAPLAKTVEAMSAELAALRKERADKLAADRKALFASRPDVSPQLVKALAKASLAECREALNAIPKHDPAASARVTGVRGESQGGAGLEGVSYLSENAAELDKIMGLAPAAKGVVTMKDPCGLGSLQVFGAPLPKGNK